MDEDGPFIDDLPIKTGDFKYIVMLNCQRVYSSLIIKMWAWNQYRHYSSGFQWDVYIQQYQMEFLNRGLETL